MKQFCCFRLATKREIFEIDKYNFLYYNYSGQILEKGKASMTGLQKLGIALCGLLIACILGFWLFWLLFVNFVDNYQMGYKFDARTGETTILNEPGYYVTPPFVVKIHTVDLRPRQVCINANQRVLNCKLVQFKKDEEALRTFIAWHGRADYEGGSDFTGSFSDILKSYAYDGSGRTYPFLTILKELKPEETATPVQQ